MTKACESLPEQECIQKYLERHKKLVDLRQSHRHNKNLVLRLTYWLAGGRRVLNIGADTGLFIMPMIKKDYQVVSIEPDDASRYMLRTHFLACFRDTQELKQNEKSAFDGFYSVHALDRIQDDVGALRDWASMLREGGRAILYVRAAPSWRKEEDFSAQQGRRYTRAGLEQVVREAGLTVVHSAYEDSIGFWVEQGFRLFHRQRPETGSYKRNYDRFILPLSWAFDRVFSPFFGENVWIVADKTETKKA